MGTISQKPDLRGDFFFISAVVSITGTKTNRVLLKCVPCCWALLQLVQKGPATDVSGRPVSTATNASNPWWLTFEKAIASAGGELSKPEILSSTTDSRFARQLGIPALGFSPMTSTPILLHDHNEVN